MAKVQSLAAQSGTLPAELSKPEGIALPAIFSGGGTADVKARELAPYVMFCHSNAKVYSRLVAAKPSVQEGDQFLIYPDRVVDVTPLKFGLFIAKQYWAQGDASGNVIATSPVERPHPFGEQIECVIIVYHGEQLIPASINFRTTKCAAAQKASMALAECMTPEWAKKSPAHELTLGCQKPFMRFFATIRLGPKTTSKRSGLPYVPADAEIHPTTMVEWKLLAEHLSAETEVGKKFAEDLQKAANTFESRIKDATAKFV
jgi:hypothetical protein